jgi:organic radical activating enzyme
MSDTHNKPEPEYETILEKAVNIPPESDVRISGGEPGTLSKNKLLKIIKLLKDKNCIITVYTNGMFFNHKESSSLIDKCVYHCSENLDNYVEEIDMSHMKNLEYAVIYSIVISESNKHNLDSFLKKNNHIKFLLNGADNRDELNKIEGIRIWNKYQNIIQYGSKECLINYYKYNENRKKELNARHKNRR